MNQTLAIDNQIAVKTLESKKAQFEDAGLDDFVVAALGLLEAEPDSFSEHILARIPVDMLEPAKDVIDVTDAALQDGVDEFEAMNWSREC